MGDREVYRDRAWDECGVRGVAQYWCWCPSIGDREVVGEVMGVVSHTMHMSQSLESLEMDSSWLESLVSLSMGLR